MVINFSRIDFGERPMIILKNAGGTPLGVLGYAMGVAPSVKYNETSEIEFDLPKYVDGEPTPFYDDVVGMRIIELAGIGQFFLINPEEQSDGVKTMKTVKGYSLEYDFTFKKITLEKSTYKFFDFRNPEETILGIIMEKVPSWSLGEVSTTLWNKYRTFDVQNANLYNFIKGTIQDTYGCVFDFDTLSMKVNVRDVEEQPATKPVFISHANLAKEISVKENTEDIVTRLDVSGAEGVDIRDVNPTGTNQIINLDYFMTTANFDQALIDKYYAWKELFESNKQAFYSTSIQYSLKTAEITSAEAKLTDIKAEFTSLENVQAATIQAISGGIETEDKLAEANANLQAKKSEIDSQQNIIANIKNEQEALFAQLQAISKACSFEAYFTNAELKQLDRYIKDGEISDSSFVVDETSSITDDSVGSVVINQLFKFENGIVTKTTSASGMNIYDIRGGEVEAEGRFSASVISATVEVNNGKIVGSAYLGSGDMAGNPFPTACITVNSDAGSVSNSDTSLSLNVNDGYFYFTMDASEYEKRSVAWDLYQYGEETLAKLSQPSYTFSITAANFFSVPEFISFRDSIKLGEKIYLELEDGRVIQPIFIGAEFNYGEPDDLSLNFSDTYTSGDSVFRLVDLLNNSVSMGKQLDTSKYIYSRFEDTGASTSIRKYMEDALDTSKQAIMSSSDQAISWDGAGLRLRRWANPGHTAYEDEQIWMNNNSILMTNDGWNTAKMAIGKFHDDNLGDCWGIVAPMIVGTILAGENLMIQSQKTDGTGVAEFVMDGDGCRLYNSDFTVTNGKYHIALNPDIGLAIGKYPIYTYEEMGRARAAVGQKVLNEENANFWVDTDGNVHIKGTLYGVDGEFTGELRCVSKDGTKFTVDSNEMSFKNSAGEPMLLYNNGVLTLYGAIKAASRDGAYFQVDGQNMGFFDEFGTPMMHYENGSLTLTGAINATALKIQTDGNKFQTIQDYVAGAQLEVSDDYIIGTVMGSDEFEQRISALEITDDRITTTVMKSSGLSFNPNNPAEVAAAKEVFSKVSQAANEVSSVVSNYSGLDAAITQKVTNGISSTTITADKISLIGYTTINTNFRVNEDGSITANNGTFNGTLTAGRWIFNYEGAKYLMPSGEFLRITSDGAVAYYDTHDMMAIYGSDYSYPTQIQGSCVQFHSVDNGQIIEIGQYKKNDGTNDYMDASIIDRASWGWKAASREPIDEVSNRPATPEYESDDNYGNDYSGNINTTRGYAHGNIGTSTKPWDEVYSRAMHSTNYASASSRTVKHNIVKLDDIGSVIDRLEPVEFVYNFDSDDKTNYGLIYEDVEQIIPSVCVPPEHPDDIPSIDYTKIVPLLIKEAQSLRARVAELEKNEREIL